MVKVKEDLTGQKFNRLSVIKQADDYITPSGKKVAKWLCKCDCGSNKDVIVGSYELKHNIIKSCGCLLREKATQRGKDSKKKNIYDLSGEYGIGYCSNTGSKFYFDLEDYDKIKDYCWFEHVNSDNYHSLRTRDPEKPNIVTKMPEIIMGSKKWDHANKDPLDNRKENLRKATPKENNRNRGKRNDNKSGVTGVWFDKKLSKWRAYIRIDGKLLTLGYFINKDEAIRVRLQAEKEYFKEFAPQQHLYMQYNIT